MTTRALTIAETISEIRQALREYIEATYHIGHPSLIRQRQALLDEPGNTFQEPFLESTPRYTPGQRFADLKLDSAVHQLFETLTSKDGDQRPLLFDPPYTHQATALEGTGSDGKSLVVMTGTGSGKTESFLLPMVAKLAEEAANRPKTFETPAIRALVLYPMNALVNDQLGRLRLLLGDSRVTSQFTAWAGRPARFARYTSRTLYPGVRTAKKDGLRLRSIKRYYIALLEEAAKDGSPRQERSKQLIQELMARGKWPAKPDLVAWYGSGEWFDRKTKKPRRAVTLPGDAELLTRDEVLNLPPDVLITNYSMLEYMLMRPLERPIFDATRQWLQDNPEEKFLLIIDEAHLYRGAAGAEVALLLRRLRARLGIPAERVQVIATSASFSDKEYARQFAAALTGKQIGDFAEAITGDLALRTPEAAGSIDDANALAEVPLEAYYSAGDDAGRLEAVAELLTYRGIDPGKDASSNEVLYDALHDFPPLALLINQTMRKALPVSELGALVFPTSEKSVADQAVSTLISLGSAARSSDEEAGLLPCRVHAFFRGLPGLWACLDSDCAVDRGEIPAGPVGAMYGQPQQTCDCGARVFELYTCRQCGAAYARAYTDDLENPTFLWQEPGRAFNAASGPVAELFPIDLLLEEPAADFDHAQLQELDLITGRLNPIDLGERWRKVWVRYPRHGEQETGDDDDSAKSKITGEFIPCGVCGDQANFGRSSVQNHQTKGDQPFQALVARQIEVQPPGPKPADDFAPLRGRKVLAFSDSRQVAARLAPNLQDYSLQDAIRPIVLKGWSELSKQMVAPSLSLENLYLAAMVGAKLLGVRLRPELTGTEDFTAFSQVSKSMDQGALTDPAEFIQLYSIQDDPPQSLLRSLVPTLTSRYYNFTALGLASLRERGNLRAEVLAELVDIPGIAVTPEEKLALVRLWLSLWIRQGIWFSAMSAEWKGTKVGSATGKFTKLTKWLKTKEARKSFDSEWLPVLQAKFCKKVGDKYQLQARNIALELDDDWGYCDKCRFTQRPFPGRSTCISCGAEKVRTLVPAEDEVFSARKGYYRASSMRALATPPGEVMSIVAAEHTAQLNSSQTDDVFSKAEMYELLFQDVNIAVPAPGEQPDVAIDLLSCTTTMEVGIDIGSLSGVALRNMPPSRANYQQRSGRAGRRGNAVATVIAFGSADTHDDHYFREPKDMISGDVTDPILTMGNVAIARRHVTAFLLQRYHQDRVKKFDPDTMPANLFEVLGSVTDFLSEVAPLNRTDFEKWLASNESQLRTEVDDWLPEEIKGDAREKVLDGLIKVTLGGIDEALDISTGGGTAGVSDDAEGTTPPDNSKDLAEEEGDEPGDTDEPEAPEGDGSEEFDLPVEDGGENLSSQRARTKLLDRLLYKGVLPRYAFPTDVVSFHIFDDDRSTPFRPVFQYAPSQGLSVALSQYAPGKVVWVDKREWTSAALYSPMRSELTDAWRDRLIYFECQDCHYARHIPWEQSDRGRTDFCPACNGERYGPGMNWLRPPGFAHPVTQPPGTSPDDAPAISYATRAKLIAHGPGDVNLWQTVTDRVQQNFDRQTLLVSNTGPRNEGYTFCTWCGLIEPTAMPTPLLAGTHAKPFPTDPKDTMCPGGRASRGLVLGTDFESDVLLIRLAVSDPVTLRPSYLSSQVALRTVAEALTIAATEKLEIESSELQAEFRPALTPLGGHGREAEIYLYDTLAGGAGFTEQVSQLRAEIFKLALKRLEACPADCEESCYRCLRSFRNRFEHTHLDRHVGASLLRYLLDGTLPMLSQQRLDRSADRLFEDLVRSGIDGVDFQRNVTVSVEGIGSVPVPILATKTNGERALVGVHNPLTPEVAPTLELDRVNQETFERVKLIDDLVISRSLPSASREVLEFVR